MQEFKQLPEDFSRCDPERPDSFCKGCRRWADHPDQKFGKETTIIYVYNSDSEDCKYIPIVEDGKS